VTRKVILSQSRTAQAAVNFKGSMAISNHDLLQQVSEIMDSKLHVSSFEQKMSKQQRQNHEQQLAKLQSANDKTFVVKRKGNEAQYKFNNSVR
jgi:nitrogen fixation protein FixH